MSRRKQASGGQAIVMVTLALFAMCGMMGLAVDLGWSFFVQKQAQASADGAALAAVHEAWQRLGGSVSNVTCPNTAGGLYCQAASPAPCSAIKSDTASNLWNGCLYAITNGFDSGGLGGRQDVTIQANITGGGSGSLPPTVSGIPATNIAYWATVRTVQTIPQLFSSVLGNTQGTVSAIATAAIAAVETPGSFYGLNRQGDCLTNSSGTRFDCGVDVDAAAAGNSTCFNTDGTSAGVTAKLCGPAGIYLASGCHGIIAGQCTGAHGDAGETSGSSANVWSQSTIKIRDSGAVNDTSMWSPKPTNSADQSLFQDPAHNKLQPPLVATGGAIASCGLPGGAIPTGSTLGPLQYYSYTTLANGKPVPDGNPITIGKVTVTFSPSADPSTSCTLAGGVYTAGASQSTTFPDFIFWGGFQFNQANNNTSVTFGAGQYVMAGVKSQSDGVFITGNGTVTGDSSLGTMFITTDGNYPGLSTQMAALPNSGSMPPLYQGFVDLKNTNTTLYGISKTASPSLADYQNYLFWQDRRNSTDRYDASKQQVVPATTPDASQHVTATSPQLIMEPGNATMTMRGVSYQPEGAWIELIAGTAAVATSHLQVITGAIHATNGNASMTLLAPDAPTIIFVTSLIQ